MAVTGTHYQVGEPSGQCTLREGEESPRMNPEAEVSAGQWDIIHQVQGATDKDVVSTDRAEKSVSRDARGDAADRRRRSHKRWSTNLGNIPSNPRQGKAQTRRERAN